MSRAVCGTGTPENLPFAGGTHVIVQNYLHDMGARDGLGSRSRSG
jgi:hypothetical protein